MGHEAYVRPVLSEMEVKTYGEPPGNRCLMIGQTDPAWLPTSFQKRSYFYEVIAFGMIPGLGIRTNGAMTPARGYGHYGNGGLRIFKRRIYGVCVGSLYE